METQEVNTNNADLKTTYRGRNIKINGQILKLVEGPPKDIKQYDDSMSNNSVSKSMFTVNQPNLIE